VVQGLPRSSSEISYTGHLKIIPFLGRVQLNQLLNQSKIVICRSGYSSIMDLEQLQNPAIFIPTPGQTEQIYLAQKLSKQNRYTYLFQRALTQAKLIKALERLSPPAIF